MRRINVAEKMMWNVVALMKRDLVGGDIESSVDLDFVGVDYFGVREEGGEFNGET